MTTTADPVRQPSTARLWLWRRMQQTSWVYPMLLRAKPARRAQLASARTDLVVEGFPGSANSYVVSALRVLHPDAVLAHHLHSVAQLARARRFGLPALLLVRDPVDAAVAQWIRLPGLDPAGILDDWICFYERALPYRPDVVVGWFPDVVADVAGVLGRVDARFGTAFAPAAGGAGLDERAKAFLANRNADRYGPGEYELRGPAPSDGREVDKAEARRSIEASADCRPRVATARALLGSFGVA